MSRRLVGIKAEIAAVMRKTIEDCYSGRDATLIAHESLARIEAIRIRHGIKATCDPSTLPGFTDTARRLAESN